MNELYKKGLGRRRKKKQPKALDPDQYPNGKPIPPTLRRLMYDLKELELSDNGFDTDLATPLSIL